MNELATQVRSKAAEDSRAAAVAAASRPEDEEKVAASMRLAYQDLGAQQKKAVSCNIFNFNLK